MPSVSDLQNYPRSEVILLQEDPTPFPNLPQDIIIDILSRIPVKSLLKFRCVSKTWRYWFSTPHFIKSHLAKSIQNKKYANHSLLLIPMDDPTELHACPLNLLLYQKSQVKPVKLQLPMQNPYSCLSLVGCCNGLFCMREGSHDIILWNPSTRESKYLPDSGADSPEHRYITYGFGYDEAHDDYKVVEIGYFCSQGARLEAKVNLYSLRTNTWRRIQKNQRGGFVSTSSGVFVNGALHWLVIFVDGSKNPWRILSLNVSELSYGEIAQPGYEDGSFDLTLGVLEGCLCIFCNYNGIRMDVWVMTDYGAKDSWTKLASIPHISARGCASPFFVLQDGGIFLNDDFCLMVYNLSNNNEFMNHEIRIPSTASFRGTATTYIESLVSPHLFDGVQH